MTNGDIIRCRGCSGLRRFSLYVLTTSVSPDRGSTVELRSRQCEAEADSTKPKDPIHTVSVAR